MYVSTHTRHRMYIAFQAPFAYGSNNLVTRLIGCACVLVFALGESKNRAHVDQQWPDSKDVRTTISHLNAEESDLFRQMLVVHAQETLLGEASFEG